MKLTPSNRKPGLPGPGHNAGALAKLEDIASELEGKWHPKDFTIGHAVLLRAPQLGVQIMEALRLRTAPLTVQAWQQAPGRTEEEVLALLAADQP